MMPKTKRSHTTIFATRFWVRLSAISAAGCLIAVVFMRWVYWRDLGTQYAKAFYTLKSMVAYLIPTLALSLLLTLLVASVLVMITAVFASHKVAGPLFRLQRVGEYLSKKTLIGRIYLREGDWIRPTSLHINKWVEARKEKLALMRDWADHTDEALNAMKKAAAAGDSDLVRNKLDQLLVTANEDGGIWDKP
jgi:hypothetical protein